MTKKRLKCPSCKAELKEFGLCLQSSSHYDCRFDKKGRLEMGYSTQGEDGDLEYITCSKCDRTWEPTKKDRQVLGYAD